MDSQNPPLSQEAAPPREWPSGTDEDCWGQASSECFSHFRLQTHDIIVVVIVPYICSEYQQSSRVTVARFLWVSRVVYCPNLILAQHPAELPAHADKEEGHRARAPRWHCTQDRCRLGGRWRRGLVSGGGGKAVFLLQRSTLRGLRAAGCPDA